MRESGWAKRVAEKGKAFHWKQVVFANHFKLECTRVHQLHTNGREKNRPLWIEVKFQSETGYLNGEFIKDTFCI